MPALIIIIILFLYLLPAIGLSILFKRAGIPAWSAFIPIYRAFVMVSVAKRPWYWVLLQFIPVIGVVFSVAIDVEFIRVFGKQRFYQQVLVVISSGFYFFYLAIRPATYNSAPQERQQPNASWRWVGIAVIAVLFISFIRTFLFETYSIPTKSMERTLLKGDIVLVSKLSYGPRLPMTVLAVPDIPGLFPAVLTSIYSPSFQLPYFRLFSSPVRRGDLVVFNFPEGDTVINRPEYRTMQPYYDVIRALGAGNADSGRRIVVASPDQYPLSIYPTDRRVAFIKRCVAMPGDTIEVRTGTFYIDRVPEPLPQTTETYFHVVTNGPPLDEAFLREEWGLDLNDPDEVRRLDSANTYEMLLTSATREKMLQGGVIKSMTPDTDSTADDYGPIWVPRKGASLPLTPLNYSRYERVIRTYEGNKLEMRAGSVYLNDREATSYTFKMNYYWMIGDNLHGSQDSRYWGFVPEDHVIGKAC